MPSPTPRVPDATGHWPFDQPRNCASFTTRQVLDGREPILLVTHDADDHGWQFHASTEPRIEDGRLVSLDSMVRRDPRLLELADLPPGWQASRTSPADPWHRRLSPAEEASLASFAHDGYELEAITQDERVDYPFELPDFPCEEGRDGLRIGDLVKLIFRYAESVERADKVLTAERMWVEIGEVNGERFLGKLNSEPWHTERLESGDPVYFEKRHVIQIWQGEAWEK